MPGAGEGQRGPEVRLKLAESEEQQQPDWAQPGGHAGLGGN